MPVVHSRHGAAIHVKDMGSGAPVLLIHGWPLTGDMWEYQTLALLEAGYRVITYDRRGFGTSSHPAFGYDYETFADELADVIEELDLQDVTLVGFSMGGGEVARYLSRHGAGRVVRVALISSVVPILIKRSDNPEGVEPSVFTEMKARIRDDRFAFLQSFAESFYGVGLLTSPVSKALLDWTFLLAIMASPKATIDCIDAFAETDFRSDLAAFSVPTLIIHGTADKTVPIGPTSAAAADALPHATFISYQGEPHGLFATARDRLNGDLLSFLQQPGAEGHKRDILEDAQ